MAQLMNKYSNYEVELEEVHHTQKLDSPSGTAITLANDIINRVDRKDNWVNTLNNPTGKVFEKTELPIHSFREENIPGTHTIKYNSAVDSIEITHTAHNRKGFAAGALVAAKWIIGKTGYFEMADLMKF